MNELDGFRAELAQAGIPFTGQFVVDDKVHRYKTAGDKEDNSWYALHNLNGLFVGVGGCWKRNIQFKWTSRNKSQMSKEDWQAAAKGWRDLEQKRAEEEKAAQERCRQRCAEWFNKFPQPQGHFYLTIKNVGAHGPLYQSTDGLTLDWLALPLQDINGVIHSAQFIAEDGTKRFAPFGRVSGCFYRLSEIPGGPILICEGYATGASLFEATGWTVVCAMNCGNLLPVAQDFRKRYPNRTIVICADNDQFTDGNPGLTKADAACKAAKCLLANPEFSDEALAEKPTDFNDLHRLAGLGEVAQQVYQAFPIVGRPIGSLLLPPKDDPTELLKSRFLCRKGGMLLNGPTGAGKSSLSIQQAACWCNGLPFFGIKTVTPMKIVIIQAEDDDGDIAEMRNGVCTGLQLTEEQRKIFFENCLIHTASKGITGEAFCKEVVRPLLDLHMPHFLMINPVLSFIGGNVKEQEVVGTFLRAHLNPVIFEYEIGCEVFHHTNKPPTGKEKATWGAADMAYLGSGSSEWANWARAILSLQTNGNSGYFKLHAAKRGARLGWNDTNGNLVFEKSIAWARESNAIFWREPTQEELDALYGNDSKDDKIQREADKIPMKFVNLIANGSLTRAEWANRARDQFGYSNSNVYRWIKKLTEAGRVFYSKVTERYSMVLEPEPEAPAQPEPEQPELPTT